MSNNILSYNYYSNIDIPIQAPPYIDNIQSKCCTMQSELNFPLKKKPDVSSVFINITIY